MSKNKTLEAERQNLRECYSIFDKNGDGIVSTTEIISVMNALGQSPTQIEIEGITKELDKDGTNQITFDDFCEFMQSRVQDPQLEEELTRAFKHFDRDNDSFIHSSELRNVLTSVGEVLTEEEVDELLSQMVDDSGRISLGDFINCMLSTK